MAIETVRDVLADEIVRAAIRLTDEGVRLVDPPVHDGTRMVLAPEGIYDRLERAVTLYIDVHGRGSDDGD